MKMKDHFTQRKMFLCWLMLMLKLVSGEEPTGCFCSVYGNTLEDCACDAGTIDDFNDGIHEDLMKILKDDYFR